jgi:ketosteroid isomerase-like protein
MSDVDTVKQLYEAFGKGDIPAIIDRLDENVAWDAQTDVPSVPWRSPCRGKANIPAFFESLAPIRITRFEPHTFFADGDKVFVLIHVEAGSKGKHYIIPNEGHPLEVRQRRQGRRVSAHHRHRPAPAHVQGRMTRHISPSCHKPVGAGLFMEKSQ